MLKFDSKDFEAFPSDNDITEDSMTRWYHNILSTLAAVPWTYDNVSIATMDIITNPESWDHSYAVRVTHLSTVLSKILREAGQQNLLEEFRNKFDTNHGVVLLNAIRDRTIPLHPTAVCDIIEHMSDCRHENEETVTAFGTRLGENFRRLRRLGIDTFEKLEVAFYQRGILRGAYGHHPSLGHFHGQLCNTNSGISLQDWTIPREFLNHISSFFTSHQVFSNGKMKKASGSAVGIVRSASALTKSDIDLNTKIPSNEEVDLLFRLAKCPFCKLPFAHPDGHHLPG